MSFGSINVLCSLRYLVVHIKFNWKKSNQNCIDIVKYLSFFSFIIHSLDYWIISFSGCFHAIINHIFPLLSSVLTLHFLICNNNKISVEKSSIHICLSSFLCAIAHFSKSFIYISLNFLCMLNFNTQKHPFASSAITNKLKCTLFIY